MKNRYLQIALSPLTAFIFVGCNGLLPYKTEFDCHKEPGGHCGSLSGNIKEAYQIAGLTNNSKCDDENISYEINEVTFQVVRPSLSPIKGVPKYKNRYKPKKRKTKKLKKKKVCKQVCKYVYY